MSEFLTPTCEDVAVANPMQDLAEGMLDLIDLGVCPRLNPPIVHRFTPGMYIREMFLEAGGFVISMKHRSEHPFVISKGKVRILELGQEAVIYDAPYTGITTPGTQRMIYALEDTVWTAFFVTDETDIETIINAIVEPQENPRLNYWREDLPQYQTNIEP